MTSSTWDSLKCLTDSFVARKDHRLPQAFMKTLCQSHLKM